jgi:hypothetical protein
MEKGAIKFKNNLVPTVLNSPKIFVAHFSHLPNSILGVCRENGNLR